MSKMIAVDIDDLEKLVMATGFVKGLEKMLYQHKEDPFVCRDEGVMTKVHDRLSKAMVRAKRIETHTDYDDSLTRDAADLLKEMSCALDPESRVPLYFINSDWMRPKSSTAPAGFSELRQKGMIEIGSVFEYTLWQSDPKETRIDKAQFRTRITDRGSKMLLEMATSGMKATQ